MQGGILFILSIWDTCDVWNGYFPKQELQLQWYGLEKIREVNLWSKLLTLNYFANCWDVGTYRSKPCSIKFTWCSRENSHSENIGSTSTKKTLTHLQSNNAHCLSNNLYSIKCLCIDASLSSWLQPSCGANFLLVLPPIIKFWIQQTAKFLVKDQLLDAWGLCCGFTNSKMAHYVLSISIRNKTRLEMLCKPGKFHTDASSTVIITIKGCYNRHIRKSLRKSSNLNKVESAWMRCTQKIWYLPKR